MKSKLVDVIVIAVLVWAVLSIPSHVETVQQVWKAAGSPVVVLDPGHGGVDGGASASDGTCEKDINLNIALDLKQRLNEEGIRVVMTRSNDESLAADDGRASIRTLKSADMRERKRIIDEAAADLTVSIHLNSFTQDPSVRGAQVFYPSAGDDEITSKSKLAAEIMQAALNEKVNSEKKRTELGKNDVYLLKDPSSPIVIAECGFLSNGDDLKNLKTPGHQEIISKTLKASICKYFDSCE
ncbi:MAG: N-acetylmuramoyl-L-alanine amidase [Firmicutes bacterium]|nr:N-acetylmuramoyl-L-alanine amidase [Bacillota bacterium]